MLADESSNSSTSSVNSSRATMFMIDNLLQKDTRYPKQVAPGPPAHTPPSISSTALQITSAPPLSETLYRSLNVVNSSQEYPDYCNALESSIIEANTRISQLCTEPSYATASPDSERKPPKKRLRTDLEKSAVVQDYDRSRTERSTSPTNSTTSSLEDDVAGLEKRKKPRTCFTNQQLYELEAIFRSQRYLPAEQRKHLAIRLQLTERKVKTWFQNRRMKEKRVPGEESQLLDPLMLSQTPVTSAMTSHMTPAISISPGMKTMMSSPRGSPQHPVPAFAVPSSAPMTQYNPVHAAMTSQCNLDYAYNAMMPLYGYSPLQTQPSAEGSQSVAYTCRPDTSTSMTSL